MAQFRDKKRLPDSDNGNCDDSEFGPYEFGCFVSILSFVGLPATFIWLLYVVDAENSGRVTTAAFIFFCVCVAGIIFGLIVHFRDPNYKVKERRDRKLAKEREKKGEERQRRSERKQHELQFGPIHAKLVCPHCQEQGTVRTKPVTRKKGISGAKATGAVLTGGLSVLATGLSRKEDETQAHCDNCGSTWHY